MATWDVIVIGLGGVGSAATYHLAAGGTRVLGIDQYPPAHDFGSSHGRTRIIRQAYFEHPSYVPLLRRAYQLWDDAEQRGGTKLFHRTGLVEIGPPDGIVIPGVLRSAADHDLPIQRMTPLEVSRRWPGIASDDHWQAVIEVNAGFLEVEQCVRTHLRLARESGASCVHGVAVHGWRSSGSGIEVQTSEGTERAARLVLAGGPWSAQLLGDIDLDLRVLRKHQYWFDPESSGFRMEDDFPCFFHETASGFYYGFPAFGGAGVKVARHSGGKEVGRMDPQHWNPQHSDDPEDLVLVNDYVSKYLPGLGRRLVTRAGCYYTMTPDEHFVLDTHPGFPQVVVVAGLSGHGFKFTSVLGEIASQLATAKRTRLDISQFSIQPRLRHRSDPNDNRT